MSAIHPTSCALQRLSFVLVGGMIILLCGSQPVQGQPGKGPRSLADLVDPNAKPFGEPAKPQQLPDLFEHPEALNNPAIQPNKRLPVPPESAVAAVDVTLKDIFKKELAEAKTQEAKAKLADHLVGNVLGAEDDPATTYAVLQLAIKLASEAGAAPQVVRMSRALTSRFELPSKFVAETLTKTLVNCKTNDARKAAVEVSLEVIGATAEAGDAETADELAKASYNAAAKLRDEKALLEAVKTVRAELTERVKLQQAADAATAKLATTPDDPASHEQLGMYLCFIKAEWPAGLEHLTKGTSPKLIEAAKSELISNNAEVPANALTAAADRWLEAANDLPSSWKAHAKAHAAKLYREALPTATGLQKLKIERALADLSEAEQQIGGRASRNPPATATASSSKTTTSSRPVANGRSQRGPGVGLIGRLKIDGQDAGAIIYYTAGETLSGREVSTLLNKSGVVPNSVRIELVGGFRLPKDALVAIRHKGGSAAGGVLELNIDGRNISTVGDDRSKDQTDEVLLRAGVHAVQWTLKGGEIGSCLITLTDKQTGSVIPIEFDRAMFAAARQLPTIRELELPAPAE